MADFYRQYGGFKFASSARPIHDACVIGYLLAPELYEKRLCNVTIEIGSPDTLGMTIVDWWGVTGKAENCKVLRRIDPGPFFALMRERIGALNCRMRGATRVEPRRRASSGGGRQVDAAR